MSGAVLGWDIGGANLKVAGWSGSRLLVRELAFPLWREARRLSAAIAELAAAYAPARHVGVTMTGELADCFASKAEGVGLILDALQRALPGARVRVLDSDGAFVDPERAVAEPQRVAGANWAATAALLARTHPDALLLDVGSTTTDVIPLVAGRCVATGRTDPERLQSGELVYTGVLRTSICALLRQVPLRAGRTRTAAEHFAIAADAYRWLGRLSPDAYTCETPDGRGVGRGAVAARLARVVCADPGMLAPGDLSRIARAVERAQRRRIVDAVRQVLARLGDAAPARAVVAGSGAFLARQAAASGGLAVEELAVTLGPRAARAAPAAAVALLLAELEA